MAKETSYPGQIPANEQEVLITRMLNAPPELVFKAWTDPDQLARWYVPKDCTVTFKETDIREGGELLSCIHNPSFGDCWCKCVYTEIIEPEKIVCRLINTDDKGNSVQPVQVGHDAEWPGETILTVLFENIDGKTKLTLHQTVSASIAKRTGAYGSWIEMLDHLSANLGRKIPVL